MGDDRTRGLADAARALAGALTLDEVLQAIVAAASRATGAPYAALGIIGEDQTIARFVYHGIDDETARQMGHVPRGRGLLGLLIREPQIIRTPVISEHPASVGFPPGHPPMESFLGAPVRSGGRIYGNLYLTDKRGGFDEVDEDLIAVLSAQAGAAIENAQLIERLQSRAVQEERDRISRDLHDGVIQTVFSIGMGLESARSLAFTDPQRVEERLDSAVDALDGVIRELRNYIFQLRPNQAAGMGLSRGLAELGREYEVNALVRPHLEIRSGTEAQVPVHLVPDLLQIVREALSNAAKHAHASNLSITAQIEEQRIALEIVDDGLGFEPGSPRVGRGLDNMRERAAALGAELEIDSAPGRGTRVRMLVPLQEEALST